MAFRRILITSCCLLLPNLTFATPTLDELQQTIQKQQAEIQALQKSSQTQQQQIEITANAVEKAGTAKNATHIGGYAEMHYTDLNNEGSDGNSKDKQEMDFHRFVLLIGHDFNESTRFFSELELEHSLAGEGENGEVELEQAYVEHDLNNRQHIKTGLFLMPVGIINETHEPDAFYGVERNNVERNIIPATWWEGGLAWNIQLNSGISFDAALTSGLFIDTATGEYKIRDGRQEVSEAAADDLATTLRMKYTGIKGLELALSAQRQNDVIQGKNRAMFDEGIAANLVETHAIYQLNDFTLRALYAKWNIGHEINTIASGASEQKGWYLEPSYRINDQWGVFARLSEWDNQAADNGDSAITQTDIGANYWLTQQVVFKFDLQDQNPDDKNAKEEFDGFNLGVGVSF